MVNPLDLSSKTVMVTGASSGIGRETALLLSQLGARVVLVGRNAERLQATRERLAGDAHRVEAMDLALSDDVPKWVQSVASQTGPIHGLIHAAGKQAAIPIRSAPKTRIDDLIQTNVYSAIMLARGLSHRTCRPPEGASFVFISSVMAVCGKPALSVYSATKAALIGLTKSLAVELASDRIRVNCIAPGFVETEMFEQARELMTDPQVDALRQAHPLGFGLPRDVANAAAFLLADTGRWVTGTTLVIDGGYSAQ